MQATHRRISLALALALTLASALGAVGPTLPLRFDVDPVGLEAWELRVLVQPEQVGDIRIERQLSQAGRRLEQYTVEAKLEPVYDLSSDQGKLFQVRVPLRFAGIERLEPGLYAQKIVVEGRWAESPDSRPLHIERWEHFAVEKTGALRRLTLEEYSKLADPAECEVDDQGRPTFVQIGIALKEEVPLPETKLHFAVPLGRFGGEPQERTGKTEDPEEGEGQGGEDQSEREEN